jgi:ABC-type transport system involved in cytochrome c biogenesis permease component
MAKTVRRKTPKSAAKKTYVSPFKIYWEKQNYLLFIIGFALIIIGFFLMSVGPWDSTSSLFFSPIILFIAYIFLFPASILFRKRKDTDASEDKEVASS